MARSRISRGLSVARWADVEAKHRRQHDRVAENRLRDGRRTESLVDLVLVALRRRVKTANEEQLPRRERALSPAMETVLAVQQHVGGAKRIRELE